MLLFSLQMCVLAGCDFVASLPGIGIKKAHQHLRRTRCFLKAREGLPVGPVGSLHPAAQNQAQSCLANTRVHGPPSQVVRALRFDGVKIPEGYEQRVQRALWTFKHQRVYCPRRRAAVHLHEVVGGELAAGTRVPAAAQVRQYARGYQVLSDGAAFLAVGSCKLC